MKKQFAFLLRILFWDAVTILALIALFSGAHGQAMFRPEPCAVGSYELGRGIVAPDGLAKLTARALTTEPQQALLGNFPSEMGGVRIWIGGRERGRLAGIRSIGYSEVLFLVPSVPSAATWFYGWQRVDVDAPLGQYTDWVVVMPVSAEIFTNHCFDSLNCHNGMPFGFAWVNQTQVIPTLNEPIPNQSTQILLYGTGWRHASRVLVWIADEFDGLAVVEGWVSPHAKFSGWDAVGFDLPATIFRNGLDVPLRGKITIQIAAQQPFPLRWWSFANPVQLEVVD